MSRRIVATLLRSTGPGQKREPVWVRRFAWLDTALPRCTQLALNYGQPGDIVEIVSLDLHIQIGYLEVQPKYRIKMNYSGLIVDSKSLRKLLNQGG